LALVAACDPVYRYRVVARNGAHGADPLPSVRITASCPEEHMVPWMLLRPEFTDAAGEAWPGNVGYGLPLTCSLQADRQGFEPMSVLIADLCWKIEHDVCRSGVWAVTLRPTAAGAPTPRE